MHFDFGKFPLILMGIFMNLLVSPLYAAELLMLEQNGCHWCKKWHEEIGGIYHKTEEGKRAPLKVLNIYEAWPEDYVNIQRERFTPTFVLIENGVEIDRLRGYSGDEFFWFQLETMLENLSTSSVKAQEQTKS